MVGDISERILPLRPAEGVVAAGLAHHARAGAVAAIGRAEAGGEEQHAVGIAVHQAGHHAMAVLAERIVGLARRLQIFGADRDVGAAERLERVFARHQARVIGRDAERQRSLMADHRVALVVRQLEDALELGKRADARACLPAPVIPLGELDLGVEALAERARHRPDGEALGARSERDQMRPLSGRARGRKSFDGKMWFGEKLRCRLRATGRLFGLELKQVHGYASPPCLSGPPCANRRSASIKSASHFIDLFLNFKCQWRRGPNFFAARERAILILFAVAKGLA